jgi:hypothetical protein
MFLRTSLNPYRDWLGLTSWDGPISHYQLLGLQSTEPSAETIRAAAEQQRQKLVSPHNLLFPAIVKKLAAELRLAERCLAEPETKAEYDRRLRGERSQRVRWRTTQGKPLRHQASTDTVTELKSHVTPCSR